MRCDKKMPQTIGKSIVQTPAHARSSRLGQIIFRFFKKVFAHVNFRNYFGLNRAVFAIGLNLHNLGTTEHKDGLRKRVVGATMGTFQGIYQNFGSKLSDYRIADITSNLGFVYRGHFSLCCIGKYAEIRIF